MTRNALAGILAIMKKLLFLIALPLLSSPARATEDWEKLEATYQVLNFIDLAQTDTCLRAKTCVELNPLLGKNPSTEKLIAFKLAGGVLHYIITKELVKSTGPDSKEVKVWLYGSILVQGAVVGLNFRIIL